MHTAPSDQQYAAAKKLAGYYNMVPNLIWSILHLAPVTFFCFTEMIPGWVYLFTAISFGLGLLPVSFLQRIQLGKTTAPYKKAGIRLIRKYSQDGDIINGLLRKKFPGYKVMPNNDSIKKYIKRTWMYERFHLMALFFMLFIAIAAVVQGLIGWALAITCNNILYNLYPMWLQQYNRLRVQQIRKKIIV
jgi:uncharacterized membrane protein YedE/YeeE